MPDKTQTMTKERYVSKTSEQAISHIIEEAGEVIAAYGKAKRFGWTSWNPELPPEDQETNQEWFLRELDDLESAIGAFRKTEVVERQELITRIEKGKKS